MNIPRFTHESYDDTNDGDHVIVFHFVELLEDINGTIDEVNYNPNLDCCEGQKVILKAGTKLPSLEISIDLIFKTKSGQIKLEISEIKGYYCNEDNPHEPSFTFIIDE